MSAEAPAIASRIREHAKNLMAFTARNRLLRYRPTRNSVVFVAPSPDSALARLLSSSDGMKVKLPPEVAEEGVGVSDLIDPNDNKTLVANEINRERLLGNLLSIQRAARLSIDEKGVPSCYVAWGMTTHSLRGGGEMDTPFVLIPAELRRSAQGWSVALLDDEPVINPALRMLLDEREIAPPEISDLSDGALEDRFSRLDRALGPHITLRPHLSLEIFSFLHEAMYRDLTENVETAAANPIVRSLFVGSTDMRQIGSPDDQMDRIEKLSESFSLMDADSSQRQAILASTKGRSFVLQGPPGTGKSQTIANIISEAVGRGRSVLFVSEKMAALDVVAKRLGEAGIADLLLPIHSHQTNRAEVVMSLRKSLETLRLPTSLDRDAARQLAEIRTRLNDYVSAVHETRKPLGWTPRDAIAHVVKSAIQPTAIPTVYSPQARVEDLHEVARVMNGVAAAWDPYDDQHFAWRDAAIERFDAAVRDQTIANLQFLVRTGDSLSSLVDRLADRFELSLGDAPQAHEHLVRLLDLVKQPTAAPAHWLTSADVPNSDLAGWAGRTKQRNEHIVALSHYGGRWSEINPADAAELGRLHGALVTACAGGEPDQRVVATSARSLSEAAGQLGSLLRDPSAREAIGRLQAELQWGSEDASIHEVATLLDLSNNAQATHGRPDKRWFSRSGSHQATQYLEAHAGLYEERQRLAGDLGAAYDLDALLSGDLTFWAEQFARSSLMRFVSPAFHRARRALRRVRRTAARRDAAADVAAGLSLRWHDQQIEALAEEERSALGTYAGGPHTDVEAVRQGLERAALVAREVGRALNRDHFKACFVVGAESPLSDEGIDAIALLESWLEDVERMVDQLGAISPQIKERLRQGGREDRLGVADALATELAAGDRLLSALNVRRSRPVASMAEAQADLQQRRAIASLDAALADAREQLRRDVAEFWNEWQTPWTQLSDARSWAIKLREAYGGSLPPAVATRCLAGMTEELGALEKSLRENAGAASVVTPLFAGEFQASAEAMFAGSWSEARRWLLNLVERIDDLESWARFVTARSKAENLGLRGAVDEACNKRLPRVDLEAFGKAAWLSGWLESVYASDPRLAGFSPREHEMLIQKFREIDAQFVATAPQRLREAYNQRAAYTIEVSSDASHEVALLRAEARKSRRHKPIRQLFELAGRTIRRLKPVVMMSPLAVSTYLRPEDRFDLVIFDEASQVRPIEALNCVYRAKQLIVVGDEMQLPPTSFFRSLGDDDEVDDEAQFALNGKQYESILTWCGAVMPSHMLEWHYRSRHESLITYSNAKFYGNKLFTLPAPIEGMHGDGRGLRLEYVADGEYLRGDNGGTNRREAERVADLVEAHLRDHPDLSVGVVSFSAKQQREIEKVLESRRSGSPELVEAMDHGDRLDGLFVKNLESVQGDERDVIIFSIAFGPDNQGQFTLHMGPLTQQGGHRRLNVAVTRARRELIIVSSIKAEHINQRNPNSDGVRHLGRYLDYAERGRVALGLEAVGGETESPFEAHVAAVIAGMGYNVVPQVGQGHYRIDLGITHPSRPGRFVLGVECDGMSYHSSRTARDRDRLRQRALEDQGWRLHRIWSQSWFHNREVEISKLRRAIEDAIAADALPLAPQGGIRHVTTTKDVLRPSVKIPDDAHKLAWTIPYEPAEVDGYGEMVEDIVEQIVEAEGCLHIDDLNARVATARGGSRAGSEVQRQVAVALGDLDIPCDDNGFVRYSVEDLPWEAQVVVRVSRPGAPRRLLERIPTNELHAAALRLLEESHALDRSDLVRGVARIFGYDRVGADLRELLDGVVESLVRAGDITCREARCELAVKLPSPRRRPESALIPAGTAVDTDEGRGKVIGDDGAVITVEVGGVAISMDPEFESVRPVGLGSLDKSLRE